MTYFNSIPTFNTSGKAFENIVGKEETAGHHDFLLLPQCFLPFQKISNSESLIFCRQQILSVWTSLKFCCLVKGHR